MFEYFISDPSHIYFTSDTHFSSKRTLKLSRRPFSNIEEMNKAIIDSWNKVVTPEDYVFHLGDFGSGDVLPFLNGKIILLYGNHERDDKSYIESFSKYFKDMFNQDSLLLNIDGQKINLCHEPSKMSIEYFNLFGHLHQLSMVKKHISAEGKIQRGLNVCWDIFRQPINLKVVDFYKNAIDNHYDKEVFY